MSTFRGEVEEFPDIRIDYFRKIPGRDSPLACFLSHVHSDHLQGLESFHSTFIYCSPTTREILLRLEKSTHRIHFRQGFLEARKQPYKHLSKLLKTIPLNTPTEIELKPGNSFRVTLLDANHCVGAVMFLIENNAKTILYTGDIRSEPWWVESLIRNPVIIPYTHGLKRLDKIYLDTTFASKESRYRRFPTKADGLKELLEKVSKYPTDTCFHLHAWTFGYEDVWIALSSALKSQIHLDEYNYSLYESLGTTAKDKNLCYEAPALYGFECANKFQNGCLTSKGNVRLHSCQRELGCSASGASDMVYIRPILSRPDKGDVLRELGPGGGGGDLTKVLRIDSLEHDLPRNIEFPYSRHSSYEELCNLVEAFKPVDVYPCTVHRGYVDLSVSIESLFGHLCFGSTFSHDEEMKMLASQRKTLERCPNYVNSQIMISSGEQIVHQQGSSPVSALNSASEPEFRILGDLERLPKRPRTSPSILEHPQDDLNTGVLATDSSSSRRRLPEFKHSFKDYVRRSKRAKTLATPGPLDHADDYLGTLGTARYGNQVSPGTPHLKHDKNEDTLQWGHVVNHGTQAEPIELSNDDVSSQVNEAVDFLPEEISEPDCMPNAHLESQSISETQLTLSDINFVSQTSNVSDLDLKAMRMRQRKQAYKAAKEPAGWEVNHALLSSNNHHGEEEVEL